MSAIVPHLSDIYRLIQANNVVEVVAPTGTGKSTLLPLTLAFAGNKIMVSTPTRTSALNLAQTIRRMAPDMSQKIGTAVEGEILYNSETSLIYATAGHVRNLLLRMFQNGAVLPWNGPNVLILDEVHSGTVDNSIIMALWLEAQKQKMPFPRLVLITATPLTGMQVQAERFTVEDRHLNVEVKYSDRNYNERNVIDAMVTRTVEIHNSSPRNEHILLFLPGKAEVDIAVSRLSQSIKDVMLVSLYGTMNREQIEQAYINPPSNVRKVVVATNVAESSVTIENIYHVLDSMLEKRAGTSSGGGESLITSYISKNSAEQRKGRTGRTNDGVCIRFITEASYGKLTQDRPLEITRVPIHGYIIELFSVGLNPSSILGSLHAGRMRTTIELLKKCGMLLPVEGGLQVTQVGMLAARLKLGVKLVAFLWSWISMGLPIYKGIVIASLIEYDPSTYFKLPPRRDEQSNPEYDLEVQKHHQKHHSSFAGNDHLHSSVLMWNSIVREVTGTNIGNYGYDKLYSWCDRYSINPRPVRELINTIASTLPLLIPEGGSVSQHVNYIDLLPLYNQALQLFHAYYKDTVMSVNEKGMLQLGKNSYMMDRRSIPLNNEYNHSKFMVLISLEKSAGNIITRTAKVYLPLSQGVSA